MRKNELIVSIYDDCFGRAVRLLGEREQLTYQESYDIVYGFNDIQYNPEREQEFVNNIMERYNLERIILCVDGGIEIYHANAEKK